MNFREDYEDEKKPVKEDTWADLIGKVKNWLFWRRARARHKYHAKNWAIFEEGGEFYPAKAHVLWDWEFIGKDMYLWTNDHRHITACGTRYAALRRIAKARRVFCNINTKRS